jgi:hypothetical protein
MCTKRFSRPLARASTKRAKSEKAPSKIKLKETLKRENQSLRILFIFVTHLVAHSNLQSEQSI